MHGAEAVGSGVTAADDDDVLVLRRDSRFGEIAFLHAIRRCEVVHREMHAVELTPRYGEVARLRRAAGQHDRVVFTA